MSHSLSALCIPPYAGAEYRGYSTYGRRAPYVHNFTLQFLTDMGLVGLLLYLAAAIPTMARWTAAAFHRTPARLIAAPILIVFLQPLVGAHSAGGITSKEVWFLFGAMMGHSLTLGWQPVAGSLPAMNPTGEWPAVPGALSVLDTQPETPARRGSQSPA